MKMLPVALLMREILTVLSQSRWEGRGAVNASIQREDSVEQVAEPRRRLMTGKTGVLQNVRETRDLAASRAMFQPAHHARFVADFGGVAGKVVGARTFLDRFGPLRALP